MPTVQYTVDGKETKIDIPTSDLIESLKDNSEMLMSLAHAQNYSVQRNNQAATGTTTTAQNQPATTTTPAAATTTQAATTTTQPAAGDSNTNNDTGLQSQLQAFNTNLENFLNVQKQMHQSTQEHDKTRKVNTRVEELFKQGKIKESEKDTVTQHYMSNYGLAEDAYSTRTPKAGVNNGSANNAESETNTDKKEQGGVAHFTEEQIKNMSPEDFAKNYDEIKSALDNGTVTT